MSNDPNTPVPDDAQPANPFADLQAELEDLDLDEVGQPLPPERPLLPAEPLPADGADPASALPAAPVAVAVAAAPPAPKLRLCPGCNEVREFVDGRCRNCGYQLSADTPHGAEAAYLVGQAYDSPRSPLTKVAIVVFALVLLGIAGWLAYPMLVGKDRAATDASTDVAGASARAQAEADVAALQTIAVDDALKSRVSNAIREGNKQWAAAGTKAYVYRYSIKEHTEATLSQSLAIVGYVGGADAVRAVNKDDQPFIGATEGLMADLNANPGVTTTFQLQVARDEQYSIGDVYVIYGSDYGRDQLEDIQPIIDSIENYKHANGQYPLALDGTVIGNIRTKGNPQFIVNGYGYIPLFRTDGAGNVLMGSGSGVKKLQPEEVTGFYLLKFLSKPTEGMDFYSEADLNYYTQKISPFPYQPKGSVRNMPLTPDGQPDGIGAVFKNGKLL